MNQGKIKSPIRQDGALGEFGSPVISNTNLNKILAKIKQHDHSSGKIPSKFFKTFAHELSNVYHGSVALKVCIRDRKCTYAKVYKEVDAGTESGYCGYVLPEAIVELEKAAAELSHGIITLTFFIRAGKLYRYEIDPKRSVLVDRPNVPGQLTAENYDN